MGFLKNLVADVQKTVSFVVKPPVIKPISYPKPAPVPKPAPKIKPPPVQIPIGRPIASIPPPSRQDISAYDSDGDGGGESIRSVKNTWSNRGPHSGVYRFQGAAPVDDGRGGNDPGEEGKGWSRDPGLQPVAREDLRHKERAARAGQTKLGDILGSRTKQSSQATLNAADAEEADGWSLTSLFQSNGTGSIKQFFHIDIVNRDGDTGHVDVGDAIYQMDKRGAALLGALAGGLIGASTSASFGWNGLITVPLGAGIGGYGFKLAIHDIGIPVSQDK